MSRAEMAITVERLSKRYLVTRAQTPADSLAEALRSGLTDLFRHRGPHRRPEEFWALQEVSFEVSAGSVLGIVGRNGAGKSTLLKLLARVTEPTSGRAEIRGRIGSLLEVGTGFDRELTGRENVYLSGAILGMRREEIRRKFDEIVAFAEVERFIDTPVKRFSSGMFLRLAFAVAAHLESEILLLDEVLAVGDAAFQRRCLGKMEDVAGAGRTILFVSHNLGAIARFCRTCLWLERGRVQAEGPADEVVAAYLAAGAERTGEVVYADDRLAPGSDVVQLCAVRIRNHEGIVTASPDARHPFSVEVEYRIRRPCRGVRIGVTLLGQEGTPLLATKDLDSHPEDLAREPGRYVSRCEFPGALLNQGQFHLSVGSDTPMLQSHFFVERVLLLQLEHVGGVGGHIADGRLGLLRMLLPWRISRMEQV